MALDATSVIADFGPGKGVVAGVAADIVDRGLRTAPTVAYLDRADSAR